MEQCLTASPTNQLRRHSATNQRLRRLRRLLGKVLTWEDVRTLAPQFGCKLLMSYDTSNKVSQLGNGRRTVTFYGIRAQKQDLALPIAGGGCDDDDDDDDDDCDNDTRTYFGAWCQGKRKHFFPWRINWVCQLKEEGADVGEPVGVGEHASATPSPCPPPPPPLQDARMVAAGVTALQRIRATALELEQVTEEEWPQLLRQLAKLTTDLPGPVAHEKIVQQNRADPSMHGWHDTLTQREALEEGLLSCELDALRWSKEVEYGSPSLHFDGTLDLCVQGEQLYAGHCLGSCLVADSQFPGYHRKAQLVVGLNYPCHGASHVSNAPSSLVAYALLRLIETNCLCFGRFWRVSLT